MLLRSLIFWLIDPRKLTAGLLLSLVMFSALAVAYSAHLTRDSYRALQRLEKHRDDLEHGYEKLLLEHSAWADYTRLDQRARVELSMVTPAPNNTVVIP